MFDNEAIIEGARVAGAIVVWLGGLVLAAYAIISKTSKGKDWLAKFFARREALNRLIANTDVVTCVGIREDHTAQLEHLQETSDETAAEVRELRQTIEITIGHNRRQDREIRRSLERQNVTIRALFALVDVAHRDGHNGPVSASRAELLEYLSRASTTPLKED